MKKTSTAPRKNTKPSEVKLSTKGNSNWFAPVQPKTASAPHAVKKNQTAIKQISVKKSISESSKKVKMKTLAKYNAYLL